MDSHYLDQNLNMGFGNTRWVCTGRSTELEFMMFIFYKTGRPTGLMYQPINFEHQFEVWSIFRYV